MTSAGILLFRRDPLEVFLAHPGGPFWAKKDDGAWTIPKGIVEDGEDRLEAAVREFEEETGFRLDGPFLNLGWIQQKNRKVVHAWACEGNVDPALARSNSVTIRLGGRSLTVPEVDRCGWFDPETALRKLKPAQGELVVRLTQMLTNHAREH